MKKRNIIIISLSTISLVFAGLLYLAVTTFPELIEEEKIEHEEEYVEEIFTDAPTQAGFVPEIDEEPAETFVLFDENYFEFDEEIPYIPAENIVVEDVEPVIVEAEEIEIEPIIEETVEDVVIEEVAPIAVASSCGSSASKIDYQVTFVAEHCHVFIQEEEAVTTQTVADKVDFEIVCEEGYFLELDSILVSDPLCEEYLEEETSFISNIHNDIVVTIIPTYAEEVMEEEEPLLTLEEKREVLNMTEINNDTAIMNTTIIAIGISEVLAYILIKRKRHHRFRFYR